MVWLKNSFFIFNLILIILFACVFMMCSELVNTLFKSPDQYDILKYEQFTKYIIMCNSQTQ